MPLKPLAGALNQRYRHHSATEVLGRAITDPTLGQTALVSSFGAELVVLLHMLSVTARDTPVIFIDTEMLFAETLTYQMEVAERLQLTDVRIVRADRDRLFDADNENLLHLHDPDACCALRKTVPLQTALSTFGSWISGRKRYQGTTRAALDFFEVEEQDGVVTGRIKINPLAYWTTQDMAEYIAQNNLPRHPMVAKGYPSIGCAPCTTRVNDGEDPRAGRWRDTDKTECGIHFLDGTPVRTPALT